MATFRVKSEISIFNSQHIGLGLEYVCSALSKRCYWGKKMKLSKKTYIQLPTWQNPDLPVSANNSIFCSAINLWRLCTFVPRLFVDLCHFSWCVFWSECESTFADKWETFLRSARNPPRRWINAILGFFIIISGFVSRFSPRSQSPFSHPHRSLCDYIFIHIG